MLIDYIRSGPTGKGTDIIFAGFFISIFRVFACEGIVEEEIHAEKETCGQEPHGCEDDKGSSLVFPFSIDSIDEVLEGEYSCYSISC